MGSTQFGNFGNFCRDSTLPVCNLLTDSHDQTGGWGGCELTGIPLSGGRRLGNLGSILLCGIAIATAIYLILRSERKKAAVGRRYVDCLAEFQRLVDTSAGEGKSTEALD